MYIIRGTTVEGKFCYVTYYPKAKKNKYSLTMNKYSAHIFENRKDADEIIAEYSGDNFCNLENGKNFYVVPSYPSGDYFSNDDLQSDKRRLISCYIDENYATVDDDGFVHINIPTNKYTEEDVFFRTRDIDAVEICLSHKKCDPSKIKGFYIPSSVTSIKLAYLKKFFNNDEFDIKFEPNSSLKILDSKCFDSNNIRNIEIPNSVETISDYAFSFCSKLDEIVLPDSVKNILPSAFANSSIKRINIPDSIYEIPNSAFRECIMLEEVTGGKNVKSIGEGAFFNCSSLKSYPFSSKPSKLSIGHSAFYKSGLTSIHIYNNISSIDNYAFTYCNNLTDINIDLEYFEFIKKNISPISFARSAADEAIENNGFFILCDTLVNFNENAISNPTDDNDVKTMMVPEGVKALGNDLFSYDNFEIAMNLVRDNARFNLVLPDSVKAIGNRCFNRSNYIKRIIGGKNISYLGYYAFSNSSIERFNIPEKITTIPSGCFANSKLTGDIIIPKNVKQIDGLAFSNLRNVKSIKIEGAESITCSAFEGPFIESNKTKIYLPSTIKTLYGTCLYRKFNVYYDGTADDWGKINFLGIDSGFVKNISRVYFKNKLVTEIEFTTLTKINSNAFNKFSHLKKVKFLPGTTLGSRAFSKCKNLSEINFDNVVDIGAFCFYGCESITEVVINKNIRKLRQNVFGRVPYKKIKIEYEDVDFCRSFFGNSIKNGTADIIDVPSKVKAKLMEDML